MSFSMSFVGLTAAVLACLCLYAASPNQRLWSVAWRRGPARLASAALLALALWALAQDMHNLTAIFTLGTALMLVLSVLPYVGAFVHDRHDRHDRRHSE